MDLFSRRFAAVVLALTFASACASRAPLASAPAAAPAPAAHVDALIERGCYSCLISAYDAASAARDLREHGFAFLFAPGFHPAMKHAGPTRREIGFRTAFNLLGPLTNPAGATRAVIGVGDAAVAPRIAEVARLLGTERTLVVHGAGVDELPLDGSGVIHDVTAAGIELRHVRAADLGLRVVPTGGLAGGILEVP